MKPEAPLLETRSSLIQRLKATINGESWEEFFHTYWELIYNVARRAGLSEADAQDIVQETVLKSPQQPRPFRIQSETGHLQRLAAHSYPLPAQ